MNNLFSITSTAHIESNGVQSERIFRHSFVLYHKRFRKLKKGRAKNATTTTTIAEMRTMAQLFSQDVKLQNIHAIHTLHQEY